MKEIRIGAAQFEHRDADKPYNLGRIRELTRRAVGQGAEIVCFHECAVTGYSFLQNLSREELEELAEPIPDGPSTRVLVDIARDCGAVVMAGLVERDGDRLHNSYVAVGAEGVLARHRKLHTFISPYLTPGDSYTVREILGVPVGILICYDNNLPENVRATTLLGAEVIIMPHVTGCTPSRMPGRGEVDPALWANRERNPARLRLEFRGPKGRGWLMRWLPARAWENGIYAVFSNPIGRDGDTVKPGLSMIVDPDGEVLTECHTLGDDVVVGLLTPEALETSSGRRYLRARRPELYGELVKPHPPGFVPITKPGWKLAYDHLEQEATKPQSAQEQPC